MKLEIAKKSVVGERVVVLFPENEADQITIEDLDILRLGFGRFFENGKTTRMSVVLKTID